MSPSVGPRLFTVVVVLGVFSACGGAQSMVRTSSTEAQLQEGHVSPWGSRAFEVEYTASGPRDCDAEHIACFRHCWNARPPWPLKYGDKGHDKYCTKKCREEYMECLKQAEARPLVFPDLATARNWLDRHKAEVLVGSIVLVAGAAFVVSTGALARWCWFRLLHCEALHRDETG